MFDPVADFVAEFSLDFSRRLESVIYSVPGWPKTRMKKKTEGVDIGDQNDKRASKGGQEKYRRRIENRRKEG